MNHEGSDHQHAVVANAETVRLESGERFMRSWCSIHTSPETLPKPLVLGLIHGLGDHSARFDHLGRAFAGRGVHVYCFDQFGHGKSPGERMRIPSYEFLLHDVEVFLNHLADRHPDSAIALFGQSMGGNLVLNHQLRGFTRADLVIAGSPMLRAVDPPGPVSMFLLRLLSLVKPHLKLEAQVDASRLSRDPVMQQAFIDDPLVQRYITLRLGKALIDSGNWAIENAHRLSTPTLITHGDADQITCHRASLEFVTQTDDHADVKIWPEGRHDLHHDIIRDEYLANVFQWLVKQVAVDPR